MATPIDENLQHPDMEVRMRLCMLSEDEDSNVQFAMEFGILDKDGEQADMCDLNLMQLSLLGVATKQFYAILEELAQAIKDSEDFAASAGFKLE